MDLLPGTIWCEAEFQYDGATLLTGSCGPNALAMALSWSHQSYLSTVSVYRYMRSRTLCDVGGASTINELDQAAQALGTVSAFQPYGEPWVPSAMLNWIDTQLDAGNAVVLNVANGQALVDTLSGKGENARDLHYHFIALIGRNAQGYFALDGDNLSAPWRVSTTVHQFYPTALITLAKPCGAIGIAPAKSKGATMHIPPGWTDQNAVLTAPNHVTVTGALRDYVLAYPPGWDSDDWPIEAAHDTADNRTVQTFQFSQLRYTKADGKVQRGNIGADLLKLQAQNAQMSGLLVDNQHTISSLQQDIGGMQTTITDLQAKLAGLSSTKAQAAIAALGEALKEISA